MNTYKPTGQSNHHTQNRPTDECIVDEASIGIAVLALAKDTLISGNPIRCSIEEEAKKYCTPEFNSMIWVFKKLRDYAYDDEPTYIDPNDIYHAFAFLRSSMPLAHFLQVYPAFACEAIIQAAFARDKLHTLDEHYTPVINSVSRVANYRDLVPGGHADGLTISELALLASMNEQSVRNALQNDRDIPRAKGEKSKQIEVPLADAKHWLRGREGFKWILPISSPDEISVPVAKDGSFFNVDCKRTKGFTVGKKGDEHTYQTFEEALTALRAMNPPYWRRPSLSTGVHGIVRGVGWIGKTSTELEIKRKQTRSGE